MTANSVYRFFIIVRASWLLVEWLFDWGTFSHVTTFSLTHPYGNLFADAIAVAFFLAILLGMWFFQHWARWTFVALLVLAVFTSPFLVRRYSLSSPPSFVEPIDVLMVLLNIAIIAMSFLPPVRACFAMKEV